MLANAQPKFRNGKTWREERAERKATKAELREQVYRLVDRRDGISCRACGRKCSPKATTFDERGERHHIIPRSLGGRDETSNLALLCIWCHEDRHKHGTLRVTGNADVRDETGRFSGLTFERLMESGWKVVKVG